MKQFHYFVYQKYIDLHVISAFEAITQYMGCLKCKKISRYIHWTIDLDTDLDQEQFINNIMENSYYLINPNKQLVTQTLPVINDDGQYSVNVSVSSKLDSEQDVLVEKLNQFCGNDIQSIKQRTIWNCMIDESSYEQAQDYVYSNLVRSSENTGIFLNPIYQDYCFVDGNGFVIQ